MHEFVLFSQVPATREAQLLSILSGVTGNQPVPVSEQILIYAQLKVQEATVHKKVGGVPHEYRPPHSIPSGLLTVEKQQKPLQKQQEQPRSYHKLLRGFSVKKCSVGDVQAWNFRAESLPEPGVKDYISRDVTQHTVTDEDMLRIQQSDLYRLKRQHIQTGHQFVHDDVIVKIYRYYCIPSQDAPTDPLSLPPPSPADLKQVDASGSWIVEVVVRVEEVTNSALVEHAKKQLLTFKETMDGALDLIAPDRFVLDTRVRDSV